MRKRSWLIVALGLLLAVPLPPFPAAAAESAGSLQLLFRCDGTIADFDQRHVVWIQTGGKALWLYDRSDQSQTMVYAASGTDATIRDAGLFDGGVVFALGSHFTHYWKDGTVRPITDLHPAPSKTWALAKLMGLQDADVQEDGTVVIATRNDLNRLSPDGAWTKLVTRPPGKVAEWFHQPLGYYGPLTDGRNIVFRELMVRNNYTYLKWVIRLLGADGTLTTLAVNPWPGPDGLYRINNGWVAYAEYNMETERWNVIVRSPEGAEQTVYETPRWWNKINAPLRIDQIGPDGTVSFRFHDMAYLYSPREGKFLQTAQGLAAAFRYESGAWYRLSNDSLYAVPG